MLDKNSAVLYDSGMEIKWTGIWKAMYVVKCPICHKSEKHIETMAHANKLLQEHKKECGCSLKDPNECKKCQN